MTDPRDTEERLAHLIRQTEDLSEVVADQTRRIERLERRLALLLEREAERAESEGGAVHFGDETPPHW